MAKEFNLDGLELPSTPNLKNEYFTEEKIAELNEKIEQEKIDNEWIEPLSIEWLLEKFKDLAITFDQKYYVDLINRYVDSVIKEVVKKKNKWYELQFSTVYQILINGYTEIEREKDLFPKLLEIPWELKDNKRNRDFFLAACRLLIKMLDQEITSINKSEWVELLSQRNCIEHIAINLTTTINQVFNDFGLVKEIITGFNNFEVK